MNHLFSGSFSKTSKEKKVKILRNWDAKKIDAVGQVTLMESCHIPKI